MENIYTACPMYTYVLPLQICKDLQKANETGKNYAWSTLALAPGTGIKCPCLPISVICPFCCCFSHRSKTTNMYLQQFFCNYSSNQEKLSKLYLFQPCHFILPSGFTKSSASIYSEGLGFH